MDVSNLAYQRNGDCYVTFTNLNLFVMRLFEDKQGHQTVSKLNSHDTFSVLGMGY
jgi:hypothetical protein